GRGAVPGDGRKAEDLTLARGGRSQEGNEGEALGYAETGQGLPPGPEKASPTSEDQAEEQSSNDEHFHGEVDGDAEQFSHVSPASVDEPDDVTGGRAGRLDLRDANRQDTAGRD